MFRHVALFRWHPGTTPADVEGIAPALQALAAELDGVHSYACGPDLGLTDTGYDFGVVAEFETRAAWETYQADPEHDRIRRDMVGPHTAAKAGIQLAS